MIRAVEELRRSAKDVDSKIDMLEWKVETLAQNSYTEISNTNNKKPIDVSRFLMDVNNVKKNHSTLKSDLKKVFDEQIESMDQLFERMEVLNEKFTNFSRNCRI